MTKEKNRSPHGYRTAYKKHKIAKAIAELYAKVTRLQVKLYINHRAVTTESQWKRVINARTIIHLDDLTSFATNAQAALLSSDDKSLCTLQDFIARYKPEVCSDVDQMQLRRNLMIAIDNLDLSVGYLDQQVAEAGGRTDFMRLLLTREDVQVREIAALSAALGLSGEQLLRSGVAQLDLIFKKRRFLALEERFRNLFGQYKRDKSLHNTRLGQEEKQKIRAKEVEARKKARADAARLKQQQAFDKRMEKEKLAARKAVDVRSGSWSSDGEHVLFGRRSFSIHDTKVRKCVYQNLEKLRIMRSQERREFLDDLVIFPDWYRRMKNGAGILSKRKLLEMAASLEVDLCVLFGMK